MKLDNFIERKVSEFYLPTLYSRFIITNTGLGMYGSDSGSSSEDDDDDVQTVQHNGDSDAELKVLCIIFFCDFCFVLFDKFPGNYKKEEG